MSKNYNNGMNRISQAVLMGLLSLPVQVLAQAEEEKAQGLEVIEVTAQKRTESVQEVPIAISAFGDGDMRKMGIANVNDLGMLTPGLETNNATSTQTSFNIRGITTNDFGIGLDAAVAVYIDGVYVGRRGTSNLNFNDVERVEILKGPQGTLFGRNSAAGAIHIITKNATDDNEADIKFTLGSHDKRKVELSTNFKINEDWNFRGGFISNHRGGYLDIANSNEKYHDNRDWSLRGALHWDAASDLEVVFRADYSDLNQQARPAVSLNTGYANGDPFAPIEFDFEGKEKREAGGVSAEVNYFMQDLIFTSITSYRQFERGNAMEDDGSAFDRAYFVSNLIEDQWQASQEFRLTQNLENFKWTVGATFFHEDIKQQTHADFNMYSFDALAFVQQGLDTRLVKNSPFGEGTAGVFAAYLTGNPFDPAMVANSVVGQIMGQTGHSFEQVIGNITMVNIFKGFHDSIYNQGKTTSSALYFDATYSITDAFDVTVGGRYTYDDKEFYIHTEATNFIDIPYPGYDPVPLIVAFQPQTVNQESSWEKFTPRLVLDYQFNDDVMAYASYSEGFKAGGFNTLGEAPPVKEETVKNSEVGLKSSWLDNRLRFNLSVFEYDYSNLQQLELVGQPIPTYNLRNVDAKGSGYDFETIWQATDDLIFTLNYGYTDTEYTKWQFFDIETQTGTGRSKVGEPISGMPKDQANVRMGYYFEGLHGQWNFHLSYAYTGDRTQGVDGPALAIMPFEQGSVTGLNDDPLNSISSYGLLNTRLSWESDNHPIFAAVYISNATDEQYIVQTGGQAMSIGSPIATPGMPRMYGVEFGMTF